MFTSSLIAHYHTKFVLPTHIVTAQLQEQIAWCASQQRTQITYGLSARARSMLHATGQQPAFTAPAYRIETNPPARNLEPPDTQCAHVDRNGLTAHNRVNASSSPFEERSSKPISTIHRCHAGGRTIAARHQRYR